MVLAGYIAEARQWSAFCDEWGEHLKRHGVPYVHMREALRGTGVFGGWKRDQTDDFLETCAKIINKHVLFGTAVVLWQDAWEYAVNVARKYRLLDFGVQDYADPYLFKLQFLRIGLMFHAAKKGYDDEISIVFDEHDVDAHRVAGLFHQLAAAAPTYLAKKFPSLQQTTPDFHNDKIVTPLQAADVGAWYVRRRYDKGVGGASDRSYEKEILRGPKFVQTRFPLEVLRAKVDGDVGVTPTGARHPISESIARKVIYVEGQVNSSA